jgi:glucan phosphoethanolaminetransferase (alkaline phosphatase superfamily)
MSTKSPEPLSRYTKFYKTMLTLSTIGTSLTLYSLLSQTAVVQNNFEISTLHGTVVIVNYAIAALSVAALILLWHKETLGIKLKIGAYVANILSSLATVFIAQPVIDRAISQLREQLETQPNATQEVIDISVSLVQPFYLISLVGGIIVSAIFMNLWWRAWKSQVEYDKK